MYTKLNPLVSVIIPCYNAERFVEKAVRSIMEQTYHNLEIICCDDCSSDSTLAILEKLASSDVRIRLIKNKSNLGIARTLNILVDYAHGNYIARMDADDIALPKRIEKQVKYLEKHVDYAMCGTNAWHIDECDRIIGKSYLSISNFEIQRTKMVRCPFYHPTVCIRAKILKENTYDNRFNKIEDLELWYRILSGFKVCNLPERLIKYRKNTLSCSYTYSDEIIQKLISLFSYHLKLDRPNAELFVRDFFCVPQKTESEIVKNIIYINYKNIDIRYNPACLRKELLFAKRNKLLIKYILCKPCIFLLLLFKVFLYKL